MNFGGRNDEGRKDCVQNLAGIDEAADRIYFLEKAHEMTKKYYFCTLKIIDYGKQINIRRQPRNPENDDKRIEHVPQKFAGNELYTQSSCAVIRLVGVRKHASENRALLPVSL
jgi:hypothetical protein